MVFLVASPLLTYVAFHALQLLQEILGFRSTGVDVSPEYLRLDAALARIHSGSEYASGTRQVNAALPAPPALIKELQAQRGDVTQTQDQNRAIMLFIPLPVSLGAAGTVEGAQHSECRDIGVRDTDLPGSAAPTNSFMLPT